jgi:hypothetical protein
VLHFPVVLQFRAADAKNILDADGDGKLTRNDIVVLWHKLLDIMQFNMPGAGNILKRFGCNIS